MQVKLTVRASGGERDVEVATRASVTVEQLAPLLGELMNSASLATIHSEGRPLPLDALLGDPGLRTGCVVTIGACGGRSQVAGSVLQLRVVGGPDCGHLLALPRGRHLIGRDEHADLTLQDPDVSRRHAELCVDLHGVSVRDLDSTNGTWLNGTEIGPEPSELRLGAVLRIGNSLLSVAAASEPPAAVTPDGNGDVLVHRPPRIPELADTRPVEFPRQLAAGSRPRLNWLPALLPAVLGIACAIALHNYQFLAFALLSPVTMLTGTASERRTWRRGRRQAERELAEAEVVAQHELDRRLVEETTSRHREFANAADIMQAASTPDCRLWERRPADASFLEVRLGVSDQPARTGVVRAGRSLPAPMVKAVPATVSLTDGALGLAGPLPLIRGSARWVIGQLLTLHSPRDLSVVALLDGELEEWRWMRWAGATVKAVATKAEEHQRLLSELVRIIADRRQERGGASWVGPWIVVLVDRARTAAAHGGLRRVLDEGPAVGVTAICVDEEARLLPPSCRATATLASETGSAMEICEPGRLPLDAVTTDRVSPQWADRLARSLAPLQDAASAGVAQLPTDVRLVELLDPDGLSVDSLVQRWAMPTPPATPIGMTASGPVELDLLRDGPHLLIAGSTGSGKSELLRSLVTGLAARHAPDDVAFVLIDYKGGAAFAECAEFPHTVGLVTDLDSHLTSRALVSLDAELRRREAAFSEAGVTDLDGYRQSPQSLHRRLPRLILVVDEFAYLADELPNFLSGLIGIAQRGRSLGLHLVLATQRPAGVVSPEIKANISLRVALRVTDPAESQDVIGSDVACRISKDQPGRGFARLADGLVEFQTARIDLPAAATPESVVITSLDAWNRPTLTADDATAGPGELQVLRAAIVQAASVVGRPLPERPWLPPLPPCLAVSTLAAGSVPRYEIRFGLTDDPDHQRQFPASHDLTLGGSIGFIGGPRSGRTSALHTFLGQAVGRLGPDELHLYLLDCSARNFEHFRHLPHCGAVVGRDDPRSVGRLVTRLVEELGARQRALAGLGASSLAEAHRLGVPMPVVVFAVDGWEGLAALSDEYDAGRSVELVLRLLRDCAAAGITVLITGDRAMLGLRVAPSLTRKLLLALTDRGDYAAAGLNPATLPVRFAPGRCVAADDGLETHLALLAPDPSPAAQRAVVRGIPTRQAAAGAGPTISIRGLPEAVSKADILSWAPHPSELEPASPTAAAGRCLLGVGGDDAAPIWADLFVEYGRFLVCGPARSGRSTSAVVIGQQALAAGLTILVAAPPRSVVAAWARQHGLALLAPDPVDESPGMAALDADLVLIDDSEQFNERASGQYLTELATSHRGAVIVTARSDDLLISFRGPAVEVRRHRCGLLLQPGPADGELLGIRTGPHRLAPLPGRGLLVTDQTRRTAPDGLVLQVAR